MPDFRLKVADLCNIPTGNIKKIVPNFFDAEKYVLYYENLQLYLRLVLKLKKHFYKKCSTFKMISTQEYIFKKLRSRFLTLCT